MQKFTLCIAFLSLVLLLPNCGGKKNVKKDNPNKDKVEKPAVQPAKDKKPVTKPVKVDPKPANKKYTTEWTIVMEIKGHIEKKYEPKFVKAIKDTYFKGKKVEVIDKKEFTQNKPLFVGKKLFFVDILSMYGDYELNIRCDTVEKNDGEYDNVPLDNTPDERLMGKKTAERLLKDIRYLKWPKKK